MLSIATTTSKNIVVTNAERAVIAARSAFVWQPCMIFPCIIYFFSVGLLRYNVKI